MRTCGHVHDSTRQYTTVQGWYAKSWYDAGCDRLAWRQGNCLRVARPLLGCRSECALNYEDASEGALNYEDASEGALNYEWQETPSSRSSWRLRGEASHVAVMCWSMRDDTMRDGPTRDRPMLVFKHGWRTTVLWP